MTCNLQQYIYHTNFLLPIYLSTGLCKNHYIEIKTPNVSIYYTLLKLSHIHSFYY